MGLGFRVFGLKGLGLRVSVWQAMGAEARSCSLYYEQPILHLLFCKPPHPSPTNCPETITTIN